jgi:hypothetical protein
MISFACRQCGKRFDRPDSAAGTLIFCACGIGNSVPYESSLPPLEPERVPSFPANPPPSQSYPPPRFPDEPLGRPYGSSPPPRDRGVCFNHPETPSDRFCADCNEPFCGDCTTEIEGKPRCGPCKNFRLRTGQRPPSVSAAALLSPLLSFPAALFSVFVILVAGGTKSIEAVIFWTTATIVPQIIAMVLAGRGLQVVETDPRYGGHSLALTGLVSAVVFSVLLATLGAVFIVAAKAI